MKQIYIDASDWLRENERERIDNNYKQKKVKVNIAEVNKT